jgi:outer membrane protein OmpA-like peptidoglycan-associated protein
MISPSGIRNAIFCATAFGIIACASTPILAKKLATTKVSAPAPSQRPAVRLEDLRAAQTSRGIVLTLGDVSFDTGRSQLKSGAQPSLDQIAAFLNENADRRVQVEGFTDNHGTNDYNLELAQSRADAVAMAMIQRGIDAARVRATGYGAAFPVASNNDDGSRQLNRRVEIIVSNGGQSIPSRIAAGSL